MNKLVLIAVPIVIIVVIAVILLTGLPSTMGGETTTSTPGSATQPTTSRTGLRTIGSTTSRTTTTINKSYICSLKVVEASIKLIASRNPVTHQLRVSVIVDINKTVNESVVIKKITIDEDKFKSIIKVNPDFIDRLVYSVNKEAPTKYTTLIEDIPPELETQWEEGTLHKVMIYYEYSGVTCKYIVQVEVT